MFDDDNFIKVVWNISFSLSLFIISTDIFNHLFEIRNQNEKLFEW